MPPDGRIQKLVAMKRRPIMYYRPQAPQGSTFIKVCLLHMNILFSAVDSLPCSAYKHATLYKLQKCSNTGLWSLLSGSSLDTSYLCVTLQLLAAAHSQHAATEASQGCLVLSSLHCMQSLLPNSPCVWQDC